MLAALAAAVLLAGPCSGGEVAAARPRVLVLGIDGATWSVMEPLLRAGELPHIGALRDAGLHGVLESLEPMVSPAVWTTIFTGFEPGRHGVEGWTTPLATNRRVDALWEIASDRGRRVAVFNVPGSYPPDPVAGVMVAGFPVPGGTFGGSTGEVVTGEQVDMGELPQEYCDLMPALREALVDLPLRSWTPWLRGGVASDPAWRGALRACRLSASEVYLTPLFRTDSGLRLTEPGWLQAEVENRLGEPYVHEGAGWSRWQEEPTLEVLSPHLEQVFAIQSEAAFEHAGGDWDLFVYVMTLVDRVSHPYWPYAHPDGYPGLDPGRVARHGRVLVDAYRRADEQVGRFLARAGGTPYVVLVSDHGFQSSGQPGMWVGVHSLDGVYVVAGPGITPREGTRCYIEDVTPTLLYLLGLPVGRDMAGTVFPDVVDMLGRPPELVPTHDKAPRPATGGLVDAATWEALRGLGYVEGPPPGDGGQTGAPRRRGARGPDLFADGFETGDSAVWGQP